MPRFQTKISTDQHADLNLIPLIDILFNILIFFAVSTTFAASSGLKVRLPEAGSREIAAERADLHLTILSDGGVYHGEKRLDDHALSRELRAAYERNPETVVIVEADQKTQHGQVVRVMDLARRNKLTHLAIATVPGK